MTHWKPLSVGIIIERRNLAFGIPVQLDRSVKAPLIFTFLCWTSTVKRGTC